jgi:hypothetical protein
MKGGPGGAALRLPQLDHPQIDRARLSVTQIQLGRLRPQLAQPLGIRFLARFEVVDGQCEIARFRKPADAEPAVLIGPHRYDVSGFDIPKRR